MARFEINFIGLDLLREGLDEKKFAKKTLVGIAKAANETHKVLQDAVFKRYAYAKKLASIKQGPDRIRYSPAALQMIEQGLVYEGEERVPLAEFPFQIDPIAKPSFFHGSYYALPGIFERKIPLEGIKSMVVRAGGFKSLRHVFPAYNKTKLMQRVEPEENTVLSDPDYDRTSLYEKTGPGLVKMAEWVYENSPELQQFRETVDDFIFEEITK